MRKNWTAILNVLICFFSVFGVLVFLFFVRGFFPDSGGLVGMSLFHILLCMGIAFVLTLSHAVIASEYLDQYFSIKSRVIFAVFSAQSHLEYSLFIMAFHRLLY